MNIISSASPIERVFHNSTGVFHEALRFSLARSQKSLQEKPKSTKSSMTTTTEKRVLEVGKEIAGDQSAADTLYDTYVLEFTGDAEGELERFRVPSSAPVAVALREYYDAVVRSHGQRGRRLLVTFIWDELADSCFHIAEVSSADEALAKEMRTKVRAIFKKKGKWENMPCDALDAPIDWPTQHVFNEQVVLDAVNPEDKEDSS
jgi:hypothetical protein